MMNHEKIAWIEDDYDQESLILMDDGIVTINVTKLRKTHINIIVGICIKILLRRIFKNEFLVFEEAFAKDLRKAIWKVLALHANHLFKGGINEF